VFLSEAFQFQYGSGQDVDEKHQRTVNILGWDDWGSSPWFQGLI